VATPHELTHLIIHRKLGDIGTVGFPRWVDEGLAMYYELVPPALEPEYETLLKRAIQNDTLLPLRTLSAILRPMPRQASLSYAQSFSVIDFIYRRHSKDKMAQLLAEFKQGGAFDEVFRKVLGVDTEGLEVAWRQDIGAKPRVIPTRSSTSRRHSQPLSFDGRDLDARSACRERGDTCASAHYRAARVQQSDFAIVRRAFSLIAVGIFAPMLYRRMRRSVDDSSLA